MASDALKDLREWQRAQASEQDKALKGATRSLARLARLDDERAQAMASLGDAVAALEVTGLVREQIAALLGVPLDELGRMLSIRRRSCSSGLTSRS